MTSYNFKKMNRKSNGYTLIEVLVATALIGFALLGTGFLIAFGIQSVEGSNRVTVATGLVQQGLDTMKGNRIEAYRMMGPNTTRTVSCAVPDVLTNNPFQQRRVWDCNMHQQIPGAVSTWAIVDGVAQITIDWSQNRGGESGNDEERRRITMEIQL